MSRKSLLFNIKLHTISSSDYIYTVKSVNVYEGTDTMLLTLKSYTQLIYNNIQMCLFKLYHSCFDTFSSSVLFLRNLVLIFLRFLAHDPV